MKKKSAGRRKDRERKKRKKERNRLFRSVAQTQIKPLKDPIFERESDDMPESLMS